MRTALGNRRHVPEGGEEDDDGGKYSDGLGICALVAEVKIIGDCDGTQLGCLYPHPRTQEEPGDHAENHPVKTDPSPGEASLKREPRLPDVRIRADECRKKGKGNGPAGYLPLGDIKGIDSFGGPLLEPLPNAQTERGINNHDDYYGPMFR